MTAQENPEQDSATFCYLRKIFSVFSRQYNEEAFISRVCKLEAAKKFKDFFGIFKSI